MGRMTRLLVRMKTNSKWRISTSITTSSFLRRNGLSKCFIDFVIMLKREVLGRMGLVQRGRIVTNISTRLQEY